MEAEKVYYRRLASGNWGVRGPASRLVAGRVVQVHKKDGTTRDEVIEAVLHVQGVEAVATVFKPLWGEELLEAPRLKRGRWRGMIRF